MEKREEKFKAAREFFSGNKEETILDKKVFYDKRNNQISLKIPKDICLAKDIDKNSEFAIVLNPKEETLEEMRKLNLIIYLKDKKK